MVLPSRILHYYTKDNTWIIFSSDSTDQVVHSDEDVHIVEQWMVGGSVVVPWRRPMCSGLIEDLTHQYLRHHSHLYKQQIVLIRCTSIYERRSI